MVDRIEQQFIVEAGRALQELNRLEAGFAKARRAIGGLSRSLKTYNARAREAVDITRSLSSTLPAVGKGLANIGRSTQKFGRNIDKTRELETNLRNAFRGTKVLDKGLKAAGKSANNLTISFETFARIIGTQIIVRALGAIQRSITDSVTSALELQKQIALIQTITPDAGILQISEAVREISDKFNLDIVETAAGLYNALSNQVGSFAEALEFSSKAAEFAKATNSSLADSVDLLSGIIKAFGLTTKDTDRIAAQLFVGIDRGRVTADELANTLGRVLEPADAIGISLEALVAGIAEITVKGTNATESLTQFRGIINALTKPTPALAKAFRELGFSSSEAAIQALELPGVLDAIVKSTDGTQEALAKLFPRIRSVGGILSLTGENLKGFEETTKEVTEAIGIFGKFSIATATDAEKFTAAINRLQNAFTQDIGNLIVRRGAALADFVGGLENIGPIVRRAIPVIESLTLSLGVLIATIALVKFTVFLGLAGPIGLVTIALIAATAAIKGFASAADDRRIKAVQDDIEAAGAASAKRLEELKKANQEEIKSEREKNKEILKETQLLAAATTLALRTQTQEALTRDKALARSIKINLQDVLSARERLLSAFTSVVQESASIIRDSDAIVERITRRQEGRDIEAREEGLSEEVKTFNKIRRAEEGSTQAARDFAKALRDGSVEGVKLAQAAFERSQSELDAARSSAKTLNNSGLLNRANRVGQEITSRQKRSEESLRRTQEQRLQVAKDNRAEVIGTNSEIEVRVKRIGELARTTDEFGRALAPGVIARNAAELEREVAELAKLTVKGLGEATAAGLADLVRDIEETLRSRPIQIKLDFLEAQKQLKAQQLEIELAVKLIFPNVEQLRTVTGRALTDPGAIGQAQSDIVAERESLITLEQRANEQLERRQGLTDEVNRSIARTTELVRKRGREIKKADVDPLIPGVEQNETTKRRVALLRTQQQAANTLRGALTLLADTGDTEAVIRALANIERISENTGISFNDLSIEIAGAQKSIVAFAKLQDVKFTPEQQKRLDALRGVAAPFQRQGENLEQSLATSKLIVAEFQKVEDSSGRTKLNFSGLLQGLGRLFGTSTAPVTEFAGIARLANGGFTRGTDTIPALLSRGESVINARASQRFFSQIQAFNAGGTPVSRAGDSNVTISTGDINVNGATNPTATAREIDRTLNRLARRGASRAIRSRRR